MALNYKTKFQLRLCIDIKKDGEIVRKGIFHNSYLKQIIEIIKSMIMISYILLKNIKYKYTIEFEIKNVNNCST